MDSNHQKEEFSYAYIHAVAAVSGFGLMQMPKEVDHDGIDVQIAAREKGNNALAPT